MAAEQAPRMPPEPPMPDPLSKASKWDRAGALASELHALLRACVEDHVTKQSLDDTSAALVTMHKLEARVRRILELVRPDEVYGPIHARIDVIAEHFLARASQQRSNRHVRDLLGGIASKRARKIMRAHLHMRKRRQIADAIRNGALTWETALAPGDDFGQGIDERVVELPLAFEVARFGSPGRILDAGSSLNHAFLRALIDPPVAELVHFTQSGEREEARFAMSQVSYVFGDLRSMPFRDGHFDRIVCISTLEHVGMDNARYGVSIERDPESSAAAVRELMRVLVPGGTLLITVPYGPAADLGWFRIFGPEDVRGVLETAHPSDAAVRYYRFGGSWYVADAGIDTIPPDVSEDDDSVWAIAAIRLSK